MLNGWCLDNGIEMVALTVDHKVRPKSTEDALAVAAECKRHGKIHSKFDNYCLISHDIELINSLTFKLGIRHQILTANWEDEESRFKIFNNQMIF